VGYAAYSAARWQRVFSQAYAHLQGQAFMGEQGLLSHYGAQDPAEFFAVVSEVFFEQGEALRAAYPAVYAELCGYYQVDPAQW
jgi:Mlc titration factor MtfA (ptsG expression regulator)